MNQIDFEEYRFSLWQEERGTMLSSIDRFGNKERAALRSVGVDFNRIRDAGGFLQHDHDFLTLPPKVPGIEILPVETALSRYPEIGKKFCFKAISPDEDRYTKAVSGTLPHGYFIRVKEGVRIERPVMAGLLMPKERCSMSLHNIVVLEQGAGLNLVTGCTSCGEVNSGLHVSVSEHFVGENASLVNTTIHCWGPEFIVRPKSATVVADKGNYMENYYCLQPPMDLDMSPVTHLSGERASARFMAAAVCLPGTRCDIGGTVYLTGVGSSAELVARSVNHGGDLIQKGLLVGAAKGCKAHVDCSGLMLNHKGSIEAVPGLKSMHPDARMSHEAAIGRIDTGALNYLRSKGLTEAEAISLIVRGFLDISPEIERLSPQLERSIKKIASFSGH